MHHHKFHVPVVLKDWIFVFSVSIEEHVTQDSLVDTESSAIYGNLETDEVTRLIAQYDHDSKFLWH